MKSPETIRRPYDIQRGTIRKGYAKSARFSEAVDLHYMGSSEFEWGALPASLRRLQANRMELSVLEVPGVVDARGNPLLAYGDFGRIDSEEYREAIRAVVHREARTRERTAFEDQMEVPVRERFTVTDAWWDINNDVMMSFDAAFVADLPQILGNSWAYMDEQVSA